MHCLSLFSLELSSCLLWSLRSSPVLLSSVDYEKKDAPARRNQTHTILNIPRKRKEKKREGIDNGVHTESHAEDDGESATAHSSCGCSCSLRRHQHGRRPPALLAALTQLRALIVAEQRRASGESHQGQMQEAGEMRRSEFEKEAGRIQSVILAGEPSRPIDQTPTTKREGGKRETTDSTGEEEKGTDRTESREEKTKKGNREEEGGKGSRELSRRQVSSPTDRTATTERKKKKWT